MVKLDPAQGTFGMTLTEQTSVYSVKHVFSALKPKTFTTQLNQFRKGEIPMMLHDPVLHFEPDSTLFQEETGLILAATDMVLTRFAGGVREGSFALYGQKFDEAARLIMSFNLAGGTCHCPVTSVSGTSGYMRSDQLVAASVDEMLRAPKNSGYLQDKITAGELQSQADRDVPSGLYVDKNHQVLVVRATHGRFLCSCAIGGRPPEAAVHTSRLVLYTVAQTLQRLDPQDEALQQFQIEADGQYAASYTPALQDVRQLIDCREQPDVQKWADWRAAAEFEGALTRFFLA